MAAGRLDPSIDRQTSCQDVQQGLSQSRPPVLAGAFMSSFLVAVLFFLAANAIAYKSQWGATKPGQYLEATWTGWALKDFMSLKERPNIVLLGSSLVLVPVGGADADFLKCRLDGSKHHRSSYLESALKLRAGREVRTFNFSLPGEIPSDAYLITKQLLKGGQAPEVIVYGLGPRDFMDSLLPRASTTDVFRYLAPFENASARITRLLPDWLERINFEAGRIIYLYGHKDVIAAYAQESLNSDLQLVLPVLRQSTPLTPFKRRELLPALRPCELLSGEAFFRPSDEHTRPAFFDNLLEFRNRYRQVKWETFVSQMESLVDVLKVAKNRGVHVVVVALPLTTVNRSLIKDYAFEAYRQSLRALALSKGATFVDFSKEAAFSDADFGDTVHLNSGGGKKLLESLADKLTGDRLSCLALQLPLRHDGEKKETAGLSKSQKRLARQGNIL